MDQIVKALGLLNSWRFDGLRGRVNPTSGARLDLDNDLVSLVLTAQDGEAPGITISSAGFGVRRIALPTENNPSLSVDPYIAELRVDLHDELFDRLAEFADDPNLTYLKGLINRVMFYGLELDVRLSPAKVVNVDVRFDRLSLQQDDETLIQVKGVSLSLLDYDSALPPKLAIGACMVVLRDMAIEIKEQFFDHLIPVLKEMLPSNITDLVVETPGPKMVAGAHFKMGFVNSHVKADLKLETENNLFGIHIERLYFPGTNVKVPSMMRNAILSGIRFLFEKKLKGLAEVSNESIRINPWPKIPIKLITSVAEFAVHNDAIHLVFETPTDQVVPPLATEYSLAGQRLLEDLNRGTVLAPGPAL